jgi:hypothetical protein
MALNGIDDRPSSSGGSEGTTESVLRQFGQRKQFRAHLRPCKIDCMKMIVVSPILLSAHTGARNFEQAVRAVVSTNFHGYAAVAPDCITLFTEEQCMQRVKAAGRRCQVGRWRNRRRGETRTVVVDAGSHF